MRQTGSGSKSYEDDSVNAHIWIPFTFRLQDSPPGLDRSSDIIPLRRSAIQPDRAFCTIRVCPSFAGHAPIARESGSPSSWIAPSVFDYFSSEISPIMHSRSSVKPLAAACSRILLLFPLKWNSLVNGMSATAASHKYSSHRSFPGTAIRTCKPRYRKAHISTGSSTTTLCHFLCTFCRNSTLQSSGWLSSHPRHFLLARLLYVTKPWVNTAGMLPAHSRSVAAIAPPVQDSASARVSCWSRSRSTTDSSKVFPASRAKTFFPKRAFSSLTTGFISFLHSFSFSPLAVMRR